MKILVTGSTGMHPWGPGGPELEHLDVRSRDDVARAIDRFEPDFVAHLAAETPSEQMRNRVLDLQGMNTMRPREEAIEDYLRTEFADRIQRVGALLGH